MDSLVPVLQAVDNRVLIVIAAIFAVCAAIAIVKKLAKVALLLLICGAAAVILIPIANSISDKWQFDWRRDEEILYLKLDGTPVEINLLDIREGIRPSVNIVKTSDGKYRVDMQFRTSKGDLRKQTVRIPEYMLPLIEQVLRFSKLDYDVVVPDSSTFDAQGILSVLLY